MRSLLYALAVLSLPMRGAWIEIADEKANTSAAMSLPMRGAWIEIVSNPSQTMLAGRRSPCGERGLKLRQVPHVKRLRMSLPMRGAWIEIVHFFRHIPSYVRSLPMRGAWIEIKVSVSKVIRLCRSPCGERGLKYQSSAKNHHNNGRSPCGERGLKLLLAQFLVDRTKSLPMRGAWIEIGC